MSLTHDEVLDLLSIITAFDGRDDSHAAAAAWSSAADIGRWTYDDAERAVKEHFATREVYLMPAHVTQLVRGYRHQRLEAQDRALEAALPPSNPATQARIRELVDAVAQRLSWPVNEDGHYDGPEDSPLAIRCPWEPCHARAGVECRTPRGRPLEKSRFHPGRADAWAEAVKARQTAE